MFFLLTLPSCGQQQAHGTDGERQRPEDHRRVAECSGPQPALVLGPLVELGTPGRREALFEDAAELFLPNLSDCVGGVLSVVAGRSLADMQRVDYQQDY